MDGPRQGEFQLHHLQPRSDAPLHEQEGGIRACWYRCKAKKSGGKKKAGKKQKEEIVEEVVEIEEGDPRGGLMDMISFRRR